jgi:hypothetical protein
VYHLRIGVTLHLIKQATMSQQEEYINTQIDDQNDESDQDNEEVNKDIAEYKNFAYDLESCRNIHEELIKYSENSMIPFLDLLTFDDLFQFLFPNSYKIYSFEK